MLNENKIVEILVADLPKRGYLVKKACTTAERGVDIIAIHDDHELYIEAKGETSSKEGLALYGSAFNNRQIKTHVSAAIFQTMKILQIKPAGKLTRVGIALLDTLGHRKVVGKVISPMRTLGIRIFWVSENRVDIQF